MKQIAIVMLIFAGLWACNMDEVEVYSAQRYLFFADSSRGLRGLNRYTGHGRFGL